jgi:glutamate N-acetyltransferase/amino-acid N-acetyltransferase
MMAQMAAECIGCDADLVLVASTGIIGHFLPLENIRTALPSLYTSLAPDENAGTRFAESIMTTDTVSKECAAEIQLSGGNVRIGGCAKGSGMIHPDMATMLAFITTDAAVSPAALDRMLRHAVNRTFNCLTIDGDTSTNDMVIALANGMSTVRVSTTEDRNVFEQGLFALCNTLCARIAADGEGASKRIEITVRGAKSNSEARMAAKAVANSNLVKTAMFGNDPNWGRILCAIGYSGVRFSHRGISVSIGGIPVCKSLRPVPFSEKKMDKILQKKIVALDIDCGIGNGHAIAHTCDLTYDYIRINAEYHT